ncbi:serine protein kinase [Botrytis cinerea]
MFVLCYISVFCITILHSVTAFAEPQYPLFTSLEAINSHNAEGKLNFSSSAPHYFASVYGLLQQWPNTFFPSGHSIVPCEIPPLTKVYHGRRDGESLPESPEWVSFDIEMAYGIMGSTRNSHLLTFQTTRTARCVYFDGESATLMGKGRMDTQMLHIYGNVTGPDPNGHFGPGLVQEYDRAKGLCSWVRERGLGGRGWGVEGFVRMNAGFEMICSFTPPNAPENIYEQKEADLTSYLPLPSRTTRPPQSTSTKNPTENNPAMPPNFRHDSEREPFLRSQGWGWFTSASAHYGSSGQGPGLGENRVKLLTCGILNYYSPKFESQAKARSLVERETLNLTSEGFWRADLEDENARMTALNALMRRRRSHNLDDISTDEAAMMKVDSEEVLENLLSQSSHCTGIDWTTMTNGIVQTYASPLAQLLQTLQTYSSVPPTNKSVERKWITSIRDQTHSFLLPFLEYPSPKENPSIWKRDSNLFQITHSRCHYHHTRLLSPSLGIYLSPEEKSLKWAVEETQAGICNILIDIGFSIENIWNSTFQQPSPNSKDASISSSENKKETLRWIHGIQELMAWLGWAGEWTSCEKKCAADEKCYIPMWPMLGEVMDRFDIRRLDIDMEIDLSQTMDIVGRLVEEMIDKVDIGLEDLDGELTKRICGNRDVWVLIILWGV